VFCSTACRDAQQDINRSAEKAKRRSRSRQGRYESVNPIKVFERDGWCCRICCIETPRQLRGKHLHNSPELDHRVPLSKGGDHTYANCQCLCRDCNLLKADILLPSDGDQLASLLIAIDNRRGDLLTLGRLPED
jgi:5-methylcytosine-specific restriction endonuclease McrA